MAETDILNPINWQALGYPFNPNPSYGFSRKMSNNRLMQRPRLGPFITRDVGNAGHSFPLSWVNTDLTTARRVVKFYHDFRNGYFTFVNPDWGGRNFVGRFTSEPEAVETANGKWTIQGALFEEIPTARMLTYPNDWVNDGHPLNVVDDFFTGGTPTPRVAFMQGAWTLTQVDFPGVTGGLSATDPTSYVGYIAAPIAGDWAQTQYTGWGFQMLFPLANAYGVVNIYLDGVEVVTGLDLSTGGCASSLSSASVIGVTSAGILMTSGRGFGVTAAYVQVAVQNVSLDIHLVKVQVAGGPYTATPSSGGGTSAIFPPLEYMY